MCCEGVGEIGIATRSDARNADNVVTPDGGHPWVERLGDAIEKRQQLAFGLLGGELDCRASGDGGARTGGYMGWWREVSVGHHHVDTIDRHSQGFGGDLRQDSR